MIGIKQFVFRWAATTIAVMVASSIIRGIRYDTVAALIGASLLLGILNAFVRPFLLILSIVSWILSAFFRGSDGHVHVLTHHTQMRRVQGRVLEDDERRRM